MAGPQTRALAWSAAAGAQANDAEAGDPTIILLTSGWYEMAGERFKAFVEEHPLRNPTDVLNFVDWKSLETRLASLLAEKFGVLNAAPGQESGLDVSKETN